MNPTMLSIELAELTTKLKRKKKEIDQIRKGLDILESRINAQLARIESKQGVEENEGEGNKS